MALVRHRRDRHQRSPRHGAPPRRRSHARRRVGPARRLGSLGPPSRPAPRPCRCRELSAIGPAAADYRARGRRGDRGSDRRGQGRRSARAGLRAPGPYRVAVLRSAADRHQAAALAWRYEQPRGIQGLHRGPRPPGVSRRVRSPGSGRGLREGDRARSALRRGTRRPRQRDLLAVRDVTRAQSARRRDCWRARSTTSGARSSSNAILPMPTPRSRSC